MQAGAGSVGATGASLGQIAIAAASQGVYEGSVRLGRFNQDGDHWHQWFSAWVNPRQAASDEQLVGGFGSGVQAASDGTLPIAESRGLLVGDVWARSVVTGADNVLHTADFAAIVAPQVGSQLAKAALGTLGDLGPAGSGAQTYSPAQGNAGVVTFGPPQVNATINVQVDGTQLQVMTQKVVDASMTQLANSISAQRG
jgi:hypothetical protein